MKQSELWAMQEFIKHETKDSRAKRLASEQSFQALMADCPRPSNVSARQWDESGKGHILLIAMLERALDNGT